MSRDRASQASVAASSIALSRTGQRNECQRRQNSAGILAEMATRAHGLAALGTLLMAANSARNPGMMATQNPVRTLSTRRRPICSRRYALSSSFIGARAIGLTSDGGQGRASLGVELWKSSQK